MTQRNDQLVEDYLARVSRATAGLRPARRAELLDDLREHVEAGRAELDAESEAQVREILDRLGDPEVIARAAAEDEPPAAVREKRPHLIALAVVIVVVVLALCAFGLFFAQSSSSTTTMAA